MDYKHMKDPYAPTWNERHAGKLMTVVVLLILLAEPIVGMI